MVLCSGSSGMGFILHHKVMEKQTDDKIAVAMVKGTQVNYPQLKGCNFDKGFHSKSNQQLQTLLDEVTLPKKGKWSKADRERERTEAFELPENSTPP